MKKMTRRINTQTWISAQGCKSVVIETNVKTHGEVKTVFRFDGEKKSYNPQLFKQLVSMSKT